MDFPLHPTPVYRKSLEKMEKGVKAILRFWAGMTKKKGMSSKENWEEE